MKIIQNYVPNVIVPAILSVKMIDAFHYDGGAILKTIVVITVMKNHQCVLISIENVRKVNFNVVIRNVSHLVGDAITTKIVKMDQTRRIVKTINVNQINSNVPVVIVYHKNWYAMVIKIVRTFPMNLTVRHVFPTVDSVKIICSNVTIQSVYVPISFAVSFFYIYNFLI